MTNNNMEARLNDNEVTLDISDLRYATVEIRRRLSPSEELSKKSPIVATLSNFELLRRVLPSKSKPKADRAIKRPGTRRVLKKGKIPILQSEEKITYKDLKALGGLAFTMEVPIVPKFDASRGDSDAKKNINMIYNLELPIPEKCRMCKERII